MSGIPAWLRRAAATCITRYMDKGVPGCPRCGFRIRGWPEGYVGITYAACPKCGKLFCR